MAKHPDKPADPTPAMKPAEGTAPRPPAGSGLSRRSFLASAAATAGVVSWSNLTIINKARAASKTLRILAWPGYDEKPVVGAFEEANGVKVEFKNYIGGEQMMQFYSQTPKGTFDAIISDAEYVQKFVAQKAVVPLKKADFPHLKDFHPAYQDFAAAAHRRCRDHLGHRHPLQLLRHLLQHEIRLGGGGAELEQPVHAEIHQEDGDVRLVSAQYEQCQPRAVPQQSDALRPDSRAARQGQGMAVQAAAADRLLRAAEPGSGDGARQ